MNTARLDDLLAHPHEFGHEAVLRVVLAPGRQDETVIELERLDDEEFRHDLIQLGVARDIGLFHRNEPRREERGRNSLVVVQGVRDMGHNPNRCVRLELFEDGVLVIDITVIGAGKDSLASFSPIVVEDMQEHAATVLRFARRLYEKIDPYGRYIGLLANASLGSRNGRPIACLRDREARRGRIDMTSVGHRGSDALRSFDRPEPVSRTDDGWVDRLAEKIANRLERRVNT